MQRTPEIMNVKLTQAERLTNSNYGNPRWLVTFSDGLSTFTYKTQANASCGYEVSNVAGKNVRLDVWLSKRGTVEYFAPAKEWFGGAK